MAQGNVIITLPGGGASGGYVTGLSFVMDHTTQTYHLIADHKDGTTTNIDLGPLSIDLQVIGGVLLGNGDFQLTVADPGGGPDVNMVIPLGNHYTKPEADLLLADKVDIIPGMGLSTEDFTTALMTQLSDYAATLVSNVSYNGVTEIISVTTTGPGGIQVSDLVDLSDKVDVAVGMGLSQNDFTNAIVAQLSPFDATSIASISFNAGSAQIIATDYNGLQTVAFTLPTSIQSDWNVTNTGDPAFIIGKPVIQNQLNANAAAIAANAQSIIDNNTTNGAEHTAMGLLISANAAEITTNHTHVLVQDAEIHANQNDIQQNSIDIGTLENENTAISVLIAANESDIDDLQLKDGLQDGRLDVLEICCATAEADIDAVESLAAATHGTIISHTSTLATHSTSINQNSSDIFTLDGQQLVNTGNISTNAGNISTHDGVITQIIADIAALYAGAALTDEQIRDAVNNAINSNTFNDLHFSQVNNLPMNQLAVTAAQNLLIQGLWSPLASYSTGDIVSFGGELFIAAQSNMNQDPTLGGASWSPAVSYSPKYIDFTAAAGQTLYVATGRVFTIGLVYVNGVKIRDTMYTLTTNGTDTSLTLTNPSTLGEWISIEY